MSKADDLTFARSKALESLHPMDAEIQRAISLVESGDDETPDLEELIDLFSLVVATLHKYTIAKLIVDLSPETSE